MTNAVTISGICSNLTPHGRGAAHVGIMQALPPGGSDLLVEMLTQSTDYGVILVDAAGRIDGWTGSAPRLFGHGGEEVMGRDYSILFVPEDVALDMHRQEMAIAAANRRSEDDRWHLRKDGSRFWGSGVLQAFGGADGAPLRYCKLVRDRSDVQTRTEGLENEVERLSAELRRRIEFAAAIVHELRAPMSPISAATDMLSIAQDATTRRRSVEILKRQIGLLSRHLDDLYDSTQASLGSVHLHVEPLVVNGALQAAVEDVTAAAVAKGIDLQLVLPDKDVTGEVDPQRLQQMVQNLIGNAIKYTPAGGKVVVSLTVEGHNLMIRVEDNGAGIDPAVLPQMFELFTREERQGETGWPGGLGVGLSLVKTLADLHHGNVEGRSLGHQKGSVFALRLPLVQPPSSR